MVGADHRLVPRRRQVDDRQPAMADADIGLDPLSLAVRAAMSDRIGHPLQHRRRDRLAVEIDEAGYSAHRLSRPPCAR